MSAGAFVRSRYVATYDVDQVHPIKVQPETLQLSLTLTGGAETNTPPAGATATTSPISARVSGGKRTLGLIARKISFRFTGAPPTGYLANQTLTVPMINPNFSTAAAGTTGTYLGVAIAVVGISPEVVR